MSSQHSNPQALEPSGRYQLVAGDVTPMDECASGDAAPCPVQVIVRSTAIGFMWSSASTLVEKSFRPSKTPGSTVVWLDAASVTFCVTLAAPDGM